jgi:class 3 adenylate cyclase/tetratricopeptide (TPR) repeat protein
MPDINQLTTAIAVLQAHRALLGDTVTNTLLELAHAQLRAHEEPRQEPRDQERRLVTVLFADLSGFTTMSEHMDAEEVAELMNALWQRIDVEILSHGGMIDKHIGDAVMAIWGALETREDDAERAVRAALAIQAALQSFNDQLTAERRALRHIPAALQLRIGINTGPVLFGAVGTTGELTAIGDTVNLAARLERSAAPGAILISHDTQRHVRGQFDLEALGSLTVRGKQDPVPVYRVLRNRPASFRAPSRGIEGIETPMVGRAAELARLQSTFQRTIDNAEQRIIMLIGDAGIGKSRLLYEFSQWLELRPELGALVRGRASHATHHVPYALLRDLLFAWLHIPADETSSARVELEARAAETLGPGSIEAAHCIGHLIGIDVRDSQYLRRIGFDARRIRQRATQALAQLLRTQPRDSARPGELYGTVVILDDMHWADTSSIELINSALALARQSPLLVICSTRPDIAGAVRDTWGAPPTQEELRLDQIDDAAAASLVRHLLRDPLDLPALLQQTIVSSAQGNPFYIEELVKMLIDEGVIDFGEHGECRVALDRLQTLGVPQTLAGVLQARLDGLAPIEREALQCAAVIGRVFWDAAVAALAADETPADHVVASLAALRQKEMIFERADQSFGGAHAYIFKHTLLRDVAYERVLLRRRRAYHARAARWLAAAAEPAGLLDTAGQIADHFDQAGETTEAARWYTRAGQRAAAQFAHSEALGHFGRALARIGDDDTARYAILSNRERVYELRGDRDAQRADLTALAHLAERLDDDNRRAEVALRRAAVAEIVGEVGAAVDAAQQALLLAQRTGSRADEAAAFLALGRAARRQAAYDDARRHFANALDLARAAQERAFAAEALIQLGGVAADAGDPAGAHTHIAEAIVIFRALGDARGESAALVAEGQVAAYQGEYRAARAAWEQALTLFRTIGDRRSEGATLQKLGAAATSQGDHSGARAALEDALRCYRDTGDRYGESAVIGQLGNSARAQGDYARAESYLREALRVHSEVGDRANIGWAHAYLSLLAHATGDNAATATYAAQALRTAQDLGLPYLQARALTQLGYALIEQGALDEATTRFRQSLALFRRLGAHNLAMEPLAGLARTAFARGDSAAALEHTDELLSYLALITLDGAEEPFRVYLTCYEILSAAADPRAEGVRDRAARLLITRAERIHDPQARRQFLEEIPIHRALLEPVGVIEDYPD